MPESDEQRRPRVARGAFPTPRSEIERAERFDPGVPADDPDGDDTTSSPDATPPDARPDPQD